MITELDQLLRFTNLFKLHHSLGEGSFGEVFKASHNGKFVAIKFEKEQNNSLETEHHIYDLMNVRKKSTINPIPIIYDFGKIGPLKWMAMDLLGPSIEQILGHLGKFTNKTILMMGREMLNAIAFLHQCNIVHCDVKPDNFAVSAEDPKKIVIFDFGLARDLTTINSPYDGFRGSLLYASIGTHEYLSPRPKDDIESLGYLLVDLFKPLPWKDDEDWPETWLDQVNFGLKQKKKKNIFAMTAGCFPLALYLMHVDAKNDPSCTYLKEMLGYDKTQKS